MILPPGEDTQDAVRWWQAYLLAENDQVDELRQRAAAGDEHARRQMASWLSDRARTEEAIEVIRPQADAGDDVAELWLAQWLADGDHLDELRERAASGSYHAPRELARRLAERDMHEELRELAVAAAPDRRQLILQAAAETGTTGLDVLRVLADLGDKTGRSRLARRLARAGLLEELRERAESGDDYARYWLAERTDQP
jgi:hypothetical protein